MLSCVSVGTMLALLVALLVGNARQSCAFRASSSSSRTRPFETGRRSSLALAALRFRAGEPDDLSIIRSVMIREAMNPLFLKPENFLVAEDDESDDTLAELGGIAGRVSRAVRETRFAYHSPICPLAAPPSCTSFAQIRPIDGGRARELASVYVTPARRRRGVGVDLVQRLAARQTDATPPLFLLTLARTAPFYERAGFELAPASAVPPALRAEAMVGTLVARAVAGDGLVFMLLPSPPQ